MITNNITYALDALKLGALVGIPTETVYGLAGNAFNEHAIQKIFQLKNRPTTNPLILHTHSIEEVLKFVQKIPPVAMELANAFWPGPLTLLLPKKALIPQSITAGSHLVAVRIPNHPVTLSLLRQLDFPLVAPSANPYTRISPTNAKMVQDYFGDEMPLILEGDICSKGIESTIVGFHENTPVIYRQGAISIEAIESIAGKSKVQATLNEKVITPGMSPIHYAPRTRLVIVDDVLNFMKAHPFKKVGLIEMGDHPVSHPNLTSISLTKTYDLEEASRHLYQQMYYMDGLNLDYIIIQKFPEIGIGKSLNDRIIRAAYVPKLPI